MNGTTSNALSVKLTLSTAISIKQKNRKWWNLVLNFCFKKYLKISEKLKQKLRSQNIIFFLEMVIKGLTWRLSVYIAAYTVWLSVACGMWHSDHGPPHNHGRPALWFVVYGICLSCLKLACPINYLVIECGWNVWAVNCTLCGKPSLIINHLNIYIFKQNTQKQKTY